MNWTAVALSVKLAALVAAILLLIGVPIAHWLTFSRRRWKFLVEAVVPLPLVLPPTVLGFYVLVALGSRSPIGRTWTAWTGHGLAFTFEALVIASILYSLPFAVQPIAASFAQIDRTLLEASAILGAGRWRTFFRILVPLAVDGIIAGAVLTFAHTLGEFGVVLMVGGNLPGITRTVLFLYTIKYKHSTMVLPIRLLWRCYCSLFWYSRSPTDWNGEVLRYGQCIDPAFRKTFPKGALIDAELE